MTCKYLQEIFNNYQLRKYNQIKKKYQFTPINLCVFAWENIPKWIFKREFNFIVFHDIYKLEQILSPTKELNYYELSEITYDNFYTILANINIGCAKSLYTYFEAGGDIDKTILLLKDKVKK
jgi:hypothetical protein